MKILGLKTLAWNNNIKVALFVLTYPLIITSTYIAAILVLVGGAALDNFGALLRIIVFEFWYIPYGFIILALVVAYIRNRNRIDLVRGMEYVTRENHPDMVRFFEDLCISRGMKMPYLFVRQHNSINAYTCGMTPASFMVVVTAGALDRLSRDEAECLLAQSLAHILNRDTRLLFLTGAVSNFFSHLCDMLRPWDKDTGPNAVHDDSSKRLDPTAGVLMVLLLSIFKLASIGSLYARLFISNKREYNADAGAVELLKKPEAMVSLLQQVKADARRFGLDDVYKPSLFHNPELYPLIPTHPPLDKRIAVVVAASHLAVT